MEQWVKITKVSNGYVVTYPVYYDEEGKIFLEKEVFEDKENDDLGYVDSLHNALWSLIEHLGCYGSRYDKKRVRINIEPGDKCEEVEDGN